MVLPDAFKLSRFAGGSFMTNAVEAKIWRFENIYIARHGNLQLLIDSLVNVIQVKKSSSIYIRSVQNTKPFHRIVIFVYSLYFLDLQDISYND